MKDIIPVKFLAMAEGVFGESAGFRFRAEPEG